MIANTNIGLFEGDGMKVSDFIKWLQTKPQHLEVCVVECRTETHSGAFGKEDELIAESVCFDDPQMQSRESDLVLVLGVE